MKIQIRTTIYNTFTRYIQNTVKVALTHFPLNLFNKGVALNLSCTKIVEGSFYKKNDSVCFLNLTCCKTNARCVVVDFK